MPGLGGEINNFKWLGNDLTKRGWPIAFIDHKRSNLDKFVTAKSFNAESHLSTS